ncbi:TPA: ABC-three component system protein [Yersinia enterocolitica]|uniref:ABC-three component system protein n=1 Tax=Yersinia kristensenii TaxID=28152 RepID=UPI000C22AB42|nr:ABC-three component system protein [Yersinia kristensenii]PJG62635.1 hypothetical protein CV016_10795 [Yersinia kristensenii]HDL7194901.1 hypothetical protein [Yersinia enterocolitica]HDL7435994.1 hypothetical protein [Yersinia enterocolitica]
MRAMKMSSIAVVFVHGFTGGSNTWKHPSGESFKELLQKEVPDVDYYEFEYFTKISDLFSKSIVLKHVKELINRLPLFSLNTKISKNKPIEKISNLLDSYLRVEKKEYSKIILIGHSMGGIISKNIILERLDDHDSSKIIGYVSIAVPHKGSINSLVLAPFNVNSKELVPLSESNEKINTEWTHRKNELPQSLYIIAGSDEFVPESSSIPYKLSRKYLAYVEHDHTSVCKPESIQDPTFIAVKNFISDLLHIEAMEETSTKQYDQKICNYDKEIFVIKMILCNIGKKGIEDAKDSFFHAEIISKTANVEEKKVLSELEKLVLTLYRQKYNHISRSGIDSNTIFYQIHKEIHDQDNNILFTSLKFINTLHKKGLLHQNANRLDDSVIWSDDTTNEKILDILK